MILFLAAQKHINLLDFLSDEGNYTIKKIAGTFSLKKFVVHDMRNFSHCSEIFLDRKAFMDSDEEFISAIDEFRCMYETRISIICEGLTLNDFLMQELIARCIGNIITECSYDKVNNEIVDCLSNSGMKKYLSVSVKEGTGIAENYKFNASEVKIAVIGAQSRIGTTSAAIGLTNWLAHVGALACYIEADESGCLKYMESAFEMKQLDNGYAYENAVYIKDANNADLKQFQFLISDCGKKIPEGKFDSYILVCGAKPYELVYTIKAIEEMNKRNITCLKLFQYTDEEYKNLVKGLLLEQGTLLFSEYQPNCLDFSKNSQMYFEVIKNYIVEI